MIFNQISFKKKLYTLKLTVEYFESIKIDDLFNIEIKLLISMAVNKLIFT